MTFVCVICGVMILKKGSAPQIDQHGYDDPDWYNRSILSSDNTRVRAGSFSILLLARQAGDKIIGAAQQ